MANFTTTIPESNAEKIRDKIAVILADEISNQYTITSNGVFNAAVWLERLDAFGETELPAFNVSLGNGDSDYKDPVQSKFDNTYYVDYYYNAANSATEKGFKISKKAITKLMLVCSRIFESPFYYKLGFSGSLAPIIENVKVQGYRFIAPDSGDGMNTMVARLEIKVRNTEFNGQISGTDGEIFDTTIKLDETEKGFRVLIDNS